MPRLLAPALAVTLIVASCGGSDTVSFPSAPDTPSTPAPTVVTTEPAPPPATRLQPSTPTSEVVVADSAAPPTVETSPSTSTSTTRPPSTSAPASAAPLPPEVVTRYSTPIDLRALPSASTSMAGDINNFGMIVGSSWVGTIERHAVWWPDATSEPQRLDGLLNLRFDAQHSLAFRVNDAGQVLVNAHPQAFLVDPVAGSSIEIVPPFGEGFGVQDLNSLGLVVGHVNIEWPECAGDCEANAITRGFVWDPTTAETTLIDPLDGAESSAASSINDNGQVVGSSDGRPFVWDPIAGSVTELDVPEAEHLVAAHPNDINDHGQIVGSAQYTEEALGPSQRSLLWDTASGEVLDLGKVLAADRSFGQEINDRGQIVIWMGQPGSDRWVLDLVRNTVTMVPAAAYGYGVSINDQGQAVGMSAERAVLWNPIT